jgi:hypothetical protein
MGACETTPPTTHIRETAAPNALPPAPIISRRCPAPSSFVLAATRLRALQLDPGQRGSHNHAATGKDPPIKNIPAR